eukprot:TRINITY_DN3987_c0_g1_i3.p1 TRINITY_DN3987_c0_g1~~TRINITY_DN3987_c0_g1_i3.p1  ORF type:complete len:548 (+),score=118.30 TRINITY_DN3987_c0_g1_i3:61-1644(+)
MCIRDRYMGIVKKPLRTQKKMFANTSQGFNSRGYTQGVYETFQTVAGRPSGPPLSPHIGVVSPAYRGRLSIPYGQANRGSTPQKVAEPRLSVTRIYRTPLKTNENPLHLEIRRQTNPVNKVQQYKVPSPKITPLKAQVLNFAGQTLENLNILQPVANSSKKLITIQNPLFGVPCIQNFSPRMTAPSALNVFKMTTSPQGKENQMQRAKMTAEYVRQKLNLIQSESIAYETQVMAKPMETELHSEHDCEKHSLASAKFASPGTQVTSFEDLRTHAAISQNSSNEVSLKERSKASVQEISAQGSLTSLDKKIHETLIRSNDLFKRNEKMLQDLPMSPKKQPKQQKVAFNSPSSLRKMLTTSPGPARYSQAKVVLPEALNYQGETKDGLPNGRGRMVYPNGDIYIGEWRAGHKHGYGTLQDSNQELKYEGEWEGDVFNGQGVWYNRKVVAPEGEFNHRDLNAAEAAALKYEGEFSGGRKHGIGTLFFLNNDRFIGEFVKGKAEGKGTFHKNSTQNIIIGEWRNGKINAEF